MYTELDKLIQARINELCGCGLQMLRGGGVDREASRIAGSTGREAFRVLDGRLQALRAAGFIRYEKGLGWKLVEQPSKGQQ